ncbi:HD domain-containing protein [Paenibacillus albiflavus]|uniref:HD domain-containing protein n=1 Tax=Paenibacillus albiflavus TaxID=2545760 RepID=A0A4R4EJN8_9BACL|nr:HD domain-containing phosphohydrolase [Paenibacillus albiflavus]TCZ78468.1 HD domain-containing protein [Paenibacillus albiflavus]
MYPVTQMDVYDKGGRLLLAKKSPITPQIINLLERHGILLSEIEIWPPENIRSTQFAQAVSSLDQRIRASRVDHYEQLEDIMVAIIFDSKTKPWGGFVQTISNYSSWLYAHSINVALLSLLVGRELGYSEKRLLELGIGAFLHDVGKILIAKSILDKPGTLDDHEIKVMRQHTEFGAKLLNGFQLPQICLEIAAKHHERMDGSGYPLGLTAAQIVEEVQIVMVADAIDAITAYRPYRSSSLLSEGITILLNKGDKYPHHIISIIHTSLGES